MARIDQVAEGIYRISSFDPKKNISFNQFLICTVAAYPKRCCRTMSMDCARNLLHSKESFLDGCYRADNSPVLSESIKIPPHDFIVQAVDTKGEQP